MKECAVILFVYDYKISIKPLFAIINNPSVIASCRKLIGFPVNSKYLIKACVDI
jgi:hypothetical protein